MLCRAIIASLPLLILIAFICFICIWWELHSEPVFLVLIVFSLLATIIDVFSRRLFIPSFPINCFSRLGTNYYWIHWSSMEIIINFSSCNYFSDECVNQFLNIKNSCIPEINYYWLWLKNISMDCYALFAILFLGIFDNDCSLISVFHHFVSFLCQCYANFI